MAVAVAALAVEGAALAVEDAAAVGDRISNGLGLYRFSYNGSNKPYVGVMAQEVQQ